MTNTNNKSKKRINVIDVIIILLVLALVGTAVYRVYVAISNDSSNKGSNYIVTFECSSEYNTMIDYLKKDKAVYLESNKSLLGYIYDDPDDEYGAVYEVVTEGSADENETGVTETANPSDAYKKVRLSGKIKLSSEAVKAQNGSYYTIKGRNISGGSTLNVYTEETVFTLTVKSITKAGK